MPSIASVRLVVGMEVHVELRTRRKVFAAAPSPAHPEFEGAEPNTLLDELTLALPGSLPVINREAVELSIRAGLALNCKIAERMRFDRKSYFYPDLPKAYQLSQLHHPVCGPGSFDILNDDASVMRTIRITRAHLEEDAGKLMHEAPGGHPIDHSIVDLNRAGTALLEIVTEPDFTTADEAEAFARQLRDVCRFIGVTEGDMQKGHMRFEPNINCVLTLEDGKEVKTPIVEIKNLNSFRAVHGAIEYEFAQQPKRWQEDGRVMAPGAKRTHGWDDARAVTVPQREKEDAHDYRYFPDPDLPEVVIEPTLVERIRAEIPELPGVRVARYIKAFSLTSKEARALVEERVVNDLFEQAVEICTSNGIDEPKAGKGAANVILQTGFRVANEQEAGVAELGVTAEQIAGIAKLREDATIGSGAIDPVFEALCGSEESAEEAATRLGLVQVSDEGQLRDWCQQTLNDPKNASSVDDLKAGKQQAVGRLIGGVMQLSGGNADAKRVRELLLEMIAE
ncbi:MAG: Asp-tRNA(Asn)/Glu-tRNA(Gln) amidotransferase subunit GatB [Planctomycetota bacterium]